MALPKSTFVMGVVTLGLFGVAIYETAGKKGHADRKEYSDDGDSYEGEDEEDSAEAVAEYERARAQRDELERKATLEARQALAKKKAALAQLYGAEVATPGSLFAGLALDSKGDADSAFVDRLRTFREETDSSVTTGDLGRYDRFEILAGAEAESPDRVEMCNYLGVQLRDAWGDGWVSDDAFRIWTNPVTKTRAMFHQSTECTMAFDKYDDPAQWISKSASSTIPLGIIGQSAEKVAEATGAESVDEALQWRVHGVGVGSSQTELVAHVEKGKVTGLVAIVHANVPTQVALREHLTTTFGKPKVDADSYSDTTLSWPARKLSVVLSESDGITVMVGKQ